MKRTKLSFYFVFILFLTLITFITLIVQKSYQSLVNPTNQIKESNITPINPKIDFEIISEIEKRTEIPEDTPIKIVSDGDNNLVPEIASSTSQLTPTVTENP